MANVLASLRALTPHRALTLGEAMRIAELQANRLLGIFEVKKPAVPETLITSIPLIRVERMRPMKHSGLTQWAKGRWQIIINGAEPTLRQRFSLAHELKHVLDAPFGDLLYPEALGQTTRERSEQICDYFAACLLMPRAWVKRAWREGFQTPELMARVFAVSPTAMRVRLMSIGLLERTTRPRCGVFLRS